ncbi:MAG TPA: cation-translocating P-type ATPase [Ferruginibacter sp.]|nr:cation-translocating P-type ATPase [Ferruginibacter sp.]HMP21334.1 cation-translocating P-type ATPase [Ferruginibacter sp.]
MQASLTGLTDDAVLANRKKHGSNTLELKEDRFLLQLLKDVVTEPMFILLMAAATIYFLVQQYQEGIIMLVAISIVAGISFYQEFKSKNAIQALKKMSASKATLWRNGLVVKIDAEDIVVDDILLLEEGEIVAADGIIIQSNDFSVNESILTGEAFAVYKTTATNPDVYRGTLVTSGGATVRVTAVGHGTRFGKIGLAMQETITPKTPLQQQVQAFVRNMVWIGAIAFTIVVGVNYYQSGNIVQSFLQGLTLAMSILPEEIPVAFSTFQALGAFRLLRNNIIVKQPQYVETLGAATVICLDKTGTITQNKMQVHYLYDAATATSVEVKPGTAMPAELIEYAMWASETTPFDPMEKALHELYAQTTLTDKRNLYTQIHEYPVEGRPPMMTHIFKNEDGNTLIAAKGAPEAIFSLGKLTAQALQKAEAQSKAYAAEGYRVLGVGRGRWDKVGWPATQQEFAFDFLGLVAFYDPPKENIRQTFSALQGAGIEVKMITGDYPETAKAIAQQTLLPRITAAVSGAEVLEYDVEQLQEKAKHTSIFARMFPEAKLKVINALKANGEIVAMTGDGVNDAPALKAAHIGVAMGRRGSDVARNAAALILADDDIGHITDAVALGRKIYGNLKKAIQYIVSIHIPIILIVLLPLVLAWSYTDIFSPVHVIFLELIMGPTCSIIYENEPMESGTMQQPPLRQNTAFLSLRQLSVSIAQGLMITAGCLGIGYWYMQLGYNSELVRSIIFISLLCSNILLTLVNRSFIYTLRTTIQYKNNLLPFIIAASVLFIIVLQTIPFMQGLFRLQPLSWPQLLTCIAVAIAATCWIEIIKIYRLQSQYRK